MVFGDFVGAFRTGWPLMGSGGLAGGILSGALLFDNCRQASSQRVSSGLRGTERDDRYRLKSQPVSAFVISAFFWKHSVKKALSISNPTGRVPPCKRV